MEDREIYIHLIPPLLSFRGRIPAILSINGNKRIALLQEHAIAVTELLHVWEELGAEKLTKEMISQTLFLAGGRAARILGVKQEKVGKPLVSIWKRIEEASNTNERMDAGEDVDYASYMPFYRSPYRAILCLDETLSNGTWKRVMDRLVEAGVTTIVLRTDAAEEMTRNDLEDLLHFEKNVVMKTNLDGEEISALYDLIVDPHGNVLEQKSGQTVGNLLEQPFYEIWEHPTLVNERLEACR